MSISPLVGKRVVIDPGHGGKFPGAIGPTGVKEKDVVLAISTILQQDLLELGADVRMTRSTDTEVLPGGTLREDLKARVDMANQWPADLFISIHANANEQPGPNGTESYVARSASDRSKTVAKLIQKSMVEDVKLNDRGVKASDFYVIKNTTMPATLLETGFLSNPEEEQKLADPAVQALFAHAIAKGVGDYFNIETHLKPDAPLGPPSQGGEQQEPHELEYLLAPGDPVEMLLVNR
jgi:N-acetylmuramoyl-L-alanine amidase